MPASRILEGSLPDRHPKAQIFSGAQPQPKTEPERDIKGKALCRVGTSPADIGNCPGRHKGNRTERRR